MLQCYDSVTYIINLRHVCNRSLQRVDAIGMREQHPGHGEEPDAVEAAEVLARFGHSSGCKPAEVGGGVKAGQEGL